MERLEATELLQTWCNRLLDYQLSEPQDSLIAGGIICPACGRIHGRCGDSVFPLVTMATLSGDHRYMDAAEKVFEWSERMVRPDDSYNNDTNSEWRGITVFAAQQLGETLHHHGEHLPKHFRKRIEERFLRSMDFLYDHILDIGGNINYPVTCAGTMALAYYLTGKLRYKEKAQELVYIALEHITEEGLLFGEGKIRDYTSIKGCRPIDMGYNVEESLPALVAFGHYMEDEDFLRSLIPIFDKHMEFMLPDGAWDNSFGTRNNKWSYWGSRTSDGCFWGFGYMSRYNPVYKRGVLKNLELMKSCTHDGLLYGGPMFVEASEPACIHHTFCHSKALAALVMDEEFWGSDLDGETLPLPIEEMDPVTYYPSLDLHRIAYGGWIADVSGYDVEYTKEGHGTGGALTLLWHEQLGPLMVGTMTDYSQVEPNNMQLPAYTKEIALTPRLEKNIRGIAYRSINDKQGHVQVNSGGKKSPIELVAKGVFVNKEQEGIEGLTARYRMQYSFDNTIVHISMGVSDGAANAYLPIIASYEEMVTRVSNRCYRIQKKEGTIELTCNRPFRILDEFHKKRELGKERKEYQSVSTRVFNPVGGFLAIPFIGDVDEQDDIHWTLQII